MLERRLKPGDVATLAGYRVVVVEVRGGEVVLGFECGDRVPVQFDRGVLPEVVADARCTPESRGV